MWLYLFLPAGESKVGRITFYMSLNVTYSNLKPHIEELASLMAKQLDVNVSQVRFYQLPGAIFFKV